MSVFLKEFCRICLCETNQNININQPMFVLGSSSKEKVELIYQKVTGLKIKPDDKLPKVLCKVCAVVLKNSYNFILKCQRSEQIFVNVLNSLDLEEKSHMLPKSLKTLESPSKKLKISQSLKRANRDIAETSIKEKKCQEATVEHKEKNCNRSPSKQNRNKHPLRKLIENKLDKSKILLTKNQDEKYLQINESNNQNNIETNHELDEKKTSKFSCTLCSETFSERNELRPHYKEKHSGKQPWQCKFCPKSFSFVSSKILHEKMHSRFTLN